MLASMLRNVCLCCLNFLCLFSVNISYKGTELYVSKTAHGCGLLFLCFFQASCCHNVKKNSHFY